MAENSAISWTRHTWNPWIGCTKVSPACDGCYAEAMMDKRYHRVQWGAPGQGKGTRSRTSKSTWNAPLKWQRQAEKDEDRPLVFCASLADIFDNQVPVEWRADAFDVMRQTPRLIYLLLTKRPQNIEKLCQEVGGLPGNAALGTSCEDQPRAEKNLATLKRAKLELAPLFSFGSFEPLLGPIKVPDGLMPDWVITGGETDQGGHKARPSHPAWFRSLRDQARAAGAAYHHKQNGEWLPFDFDELSSEELESGEIEGKIGGFADQPMVRVGKKRSGRLLDGTEHNGYPAHSFYTDP